MKSPRALDDRARGQQQPGVDQRQAVDQPDGGPAGLGAGRGRRGQQDPAGESHRSRARVADQAEGDRGQDRLRCGQVRLPEDRRSLSRQAVDGTRAACGQGQGPDQGCDLIPASSSRVGGDMRTSLRWAFHLSLPGLSSATSAKPKSRTQPRLGTHCTHLSGITETSPVMTKVGGIPSSSKTWWASCVNLLGNRDS